MIKRIALFRRRRDLDLAAFRKYWRNEHAKVALQIPGLVRYVQNHVLDGEAPAAASREAAVTDDAMAYDGIAEVWFEDMDAVRATVGIPELDAVAADEKHFIDGESMQAIVADEIVTDASARQANAVKLWRFSKRDTALSPAAFFDAVRQVPSPSLAQRVEQNHCRRGIYAKGLEPLVDAVRMEWYDDEATAISARMNRAEATLEDPRHSGSLLTREVIVLA